MWARAGLKNVLSHVSLAVGQGLTLGLVGESGSGKSTLARLMLGMERPLSGKVLYKGNPMPRPFSGPWKKLRSKMQMVFQDPYAALDKRMTILEQAAEPLLIHGLADKKTALELARESLAKVSFPAHCLERKPGSLSGGQLQRAVIARAVILKPEFLICDEPVASLDVSIQAQVLILLSQLKADLNMSMVFVSHDLNVVSHISDHLAVLHRGRLVESGPVKQIFDRPAHPYTELLLSCAPGSKKTFVQASFSRDEAQASGCAFYRRCPRRQSECRDMAPPLSAVAPARQAACFFPLV
jgi:peptide/nickel transport system ATP-binding protein